MLAGEGGGVVANLRWEWKFIMVNAQASSRLTYHVVLMIDSMSKILSNMDISLGDMAMWHSSNTLNKIWKYFWAIRQVSNTLNNIEIFLGNMATWHVSGNQQDGTPASTILPPYNLTLP